MKKFLRLLLLGGLSICLILITAISVIWMRAPDFAAKRIEQALNVPTTISSIHFFLNSISIKNLEIENLPQSYLKKAFSAESIYIKNNILNYLDKTVTVDQISIDNIYLGLEFDSPKGTTGNWTTLMNNLDSSLTKPSKEDSQFIEIKELILTNIQVEVAYKSAGKKIKKLKLIPKIVLYNINSSEGLPSEQIMKSVLGQMLQSVSMKENLKNMFSEIFTQPKDALDTLLSPFKSIF